MANSVKFSYKLFGSDLVVINCAGKTNVDWCEDNPVESLAVNLAGPIILTKTLQSITGGKALLVHISTDFIFGGTGPFSEESRPSPLSVYGVQKYLADEVVKDYPNHLIVRTTGLYGAHPRKRTFVHWVLDELKSERRKLVVYDGQWTTPTYAPWLAETILKLAQTSQRGVINAAGQSFVSRYDWAMAIAGAFGYDRNDVIPTDKQPVQTAARPDVGGLKVQKLAVAGYRIPSLYESLKELVKVWPL